MGPSDSSTGSTGITGWYDLFSRGARDWLRHNEKVREAVREHLPGIIAGGDVVSGSARTVRVPVRMLEHYHFRLTDPAEQTGVGQGAAKPGDTLGQPSDPGAKDKGQGGRTRGGVEFLLEFKVDDIVDWLWEEMQLPNLKARIGKTEEEDYTREGWDRRGARSRLDRRRSLRESLKRRSVQGDSPAFTDEDLRFRQLARRSLPSLQAVVFLLLDVSGSMSEQDRQLAKSFFFWAVQGLRRQYRHLDIVFVAHTTEAWEFGEEEFFRVSASGGTVASTGFAKVREIIAARFDPSRYNVYMFYASDGDNASDDRAAASGLLGELARDANYCGYLEIGGSAILQRTSDTETTQMFAELANAGQPVGSFRLQKFEDIWAAVKHFFRHQAE